MPRSASPPARGSRRSPSPRRDRERDRHRESDRNRSDRDDKRSSRDTDRDRDRDRDRVHDHDRERDRDRQRERGGDRDEPPRGSHASRKPRELSFYKKSGSGSAPGSGSGSMGSLSHRRDPLDVEETSKERAERRERGNVPARFGGTREQGVRNTMSVSAPGAGGSTGSFKRSADPLDRIPGSGSGTGVGGVVGGGGTGGGLNEADRRQQERVAAMGISGSGTAGPASGPPSGIPTPRGGRMIEVIANDRLGKKVRVKCLPTDTVGDLKKLIAVQTGTAYQKIQLKKWYTIYKDHISLRDYEINDGMSLEMY